MTNPEISSKARISHSLPGLLVAISNLTILCSLSYGYSNSTDTQFICMTNVLYPTYRAFISNISKLCLVQLQCLDLRF